MKRRRALAAALATSGIAVAVVVGAHQVSANDGVDPVEAAQNMARGDGAAGAEQIEWVSTTLAQAEQTLFKNVVADTANVYVIQFKADFSHAIIRHPYGVAAPDNLNYGLLVVNAKTGVVSSAGMNPSPIDLSAFGPVQHGG